MCWALMMTCIHILDVIMENKCILIFPFFSRQSCTKWSWSQPRHVTCHLNHAPKVKCRLLKKVAFMCYVDYKLIKTLLVVVLRGELSDHVGALSSRIFYLYLRYRPLRHPSTVSITIIYLSCTQDKCHYPSLHRSHYLILLECGITSEWGSYPY